MSRSTGDLGIRFERAPAAGTTAVLEHQVAPLKMIRAFRHGRAGALAHLHNVSGGVLSGDRLTTQVTVGPDAHALLTTTGATRVYRRRAGDGPGVQMQMATVAAGGRLEVLPDPTILFGGAAFAQESVWRLDHGAGLLAWDILSPGRGGHEELFGFETFSSRLSIFAGDVPIARERYVLTPDVAVRRTQLGGRTHVGNLYFCNVGSPPDLWLTIEREAHQVLTTVAGELQSPHFTFGASALVRDGLTVRVLDCGTMGVLLAFERLRAHLRARVWQMDDPMPRKIY